MADRYIMMKNKFSLLLWVNKKITPCEFQPFKFSELRQNKRQICLVNDPLDLLTRLNGGLAVV